LKRPSLNPEKVSLYDVWNHYEITRDLVVQASGMRKHHVSITNGSFNPKFFGMTQDEVEHLLKETDNQACMFIIAATEAAILTDYWQRLRRRSKDAVTRDFRAINQRAQQRVNKNVKLDEDILEIWCKRSNEAKSCVGRFRSALKYRHWLAHGRWTVLHGNVHDNPTVVYKIVTDLLIALDIRLDS
jgi:hypothetical protein